jgi:hypothetical protein
MSMGSKSSRGVGLQGLCGDLVFSADLGDGAGEVVRDLRGDQGLGLSGETVRVVPLSPVSWALTSWASRTTRAASMIGDSDGWNLFADLRIKIV